VNSQQTTLKMPVTLEGIGVHTGLSSTLTLRPAGAYTGLIFCAGGQQIPARWDRVISSTLCTALGDAESVSISTVEHLLSALSALGVDNAYIDISGPEVPILDGSAAPFVALIDRAGLRYLPEPKRYLKIKKTVRVSSGSAYIQLEPSSAGFHLDVTIDFSPHSIGRQHQSMTLNGTDYRAFIASARTFGFMEDVIKLRAQGLAQGASLDNALVYDAQGPVNPLRFSDECVRHKMLDAIGDLALAGYPIQGLCRSVCGGHRLNVGILKELFSDPKAYEIVEIAAKPQSTGARFYKNTSLHSSKSTASGTLPLRRECA